MFPTLSKKIKMLWNINGDISSYQLKIVFIALMLKK